MQGLILSASEVQKNQIQYKTEMKGASWIGTLLVSKRKKQ